MNAFCHAILVGDLGVHDRRIYDRRRFIRGVYTTEVTVTHRAETYQVLLVYRKITDE